MIILALSMFRFVYKANDMPGPGTYEIMKKTKWLEKGERENKERGRSATTTTKKTTTMPLTTEMLVRMHQKLIGLVLWILLEKR